MYALDWRWLFVQPDTKALQLFLDKVLVCEGLEAVQADEDEVAGPRHGNDLATTPLPVLGTLDNTGEIK